MYSEPWTARSPEKKYVPGSGDRGTGKPRRYQVVFPLKCPKMEFIVISTGNGSANTKCIAAMVDVLRTAPYSE